MHTAGERLLPFVLVVFSTDKTIAAAMAAVKALISVREGKKELTLVFCSAEKKKLTILHWVGRT